VPKKLGVFAGCNIKINGRLKLGGGWKKCGSVYSVGGLWAEAIGISNEKNDVGRGGEEQFRYPGRWGVCLTWEVQGFFFVGLVVLVR